MSCTLWLVSTCQTDKIPILESHFLMHLTRVSDPFYNKLKINTISQVIEGIPEISLYCIVATQELRTHFVGHNNANCQTFKLSVRHWSHGQCWWSNLVKSMVKHDHIDDPEMCEGLPTPSPMPSPFPAALKTSQKLGWGQIMSSQTHFHSAPQTNNWWGRLSSLLRGNDRSTTKGMLMWMKIAPKSVDGSWGVMWQPP